MNRFVILLLLLPATGLLAQKSDTIRTQPAFNPNDRRNGYELYPSTNQIVGSGVNTMVMTIDNRYEGLRGTPYFLPAWNNGKIEMTAGQNYTNVPIKFDAYRQQLILLRTWVGSDSIIVSADRVKSFQLQNKDGNTYLFTRVPTAKTDDETLRQSYYLVLYQGKTSLLKRIVKTFKQADYKNPYSNDIRYDAFEDAFSYYLLKPDMSLTRVKLSEKSLLDALSDQKEALKAFIQQQKLSPKTEPDAVAVVRQYDKL